MTPEQRDRERISQRLADEGFQDGDLWVLRKSRKEIARAVPTLLELLKEVQSPRVMIDLVETVTEVPISPHPLVEVLKGLGDDVEREYKPPANLDKLRGKAFAAELERIGALSTGAGALAWSIADALVRIVDSSVYEDIVRILRDRRFGMRRQLLPYALVKVPERREETLALFLELVEDPDITPPILDAIGIMKATEALPVVEKYLGSSVPLQKSTAKKTLKKLQAQLGKKTPKSRAKVLPPRTPEELVNLAEASMNFDLEQVAPFLKAISRLVGDFGVAEREHIADRLLEMEPDEEESFDFTVVHEGREVPLHIEVFMDDVEAPDIAFITTPELAAAIDALLEKAMQ